MHGQGKILAGMLLAGLLFLAGCVYRPLHGISTSGEYAYGSELSQVWVDQVDSRVAQQVRNHLVFLLQGGRDDPQVRYLTRLRVVDTGRQFAAVKGIRDQTAGSVTVSVSYELFDTQDYSRVSGGQRVATASYDRTRQNFANSRAVRDAQNRAAREAAEKIRLALAADLER